MKNTRRDFIKQASMLGAGAGLLHFFPPAIQKAFSIQAAPGTSYLDAEHVVFLMQENRSFDHMYGALRGVRGFDDPRAIRLNNGNPVWLQSDQGKTYAPFRLNLRDTRSTWMSSLPHAWTDQVDACNNGAHDGWIKAKRSYNEEYAGMPLTLGYYDRRDLPFYYALADAFTVCDQHFCSSLTGTTPNRLYFWSGTIKDPDDPSGHARVWNGDADYDTPVGWKSFPERLEENGIPWKVYQNEISVGVGMSGEESSWLENFTDNALEFMSAYNVKLNPAYIKNLPAQEKRIRKTITELEEKIKNAPAAQLENLTKELNGARESLVQNQHDQREYTLEKYHALSDEEKRLHEKAFTTNRADPEFGKLEEVTYKDKGLTRTMKVPAGDVLFQFRKDVDEGKLPMVSWLVAPENFSDHPGAPWYGAWYLSEVFNILTRNPEVWKKTIFILTYDENDGYFDHVPPFLPPVNATDGKMSSGLDARSEFVSRAQQSSEPGEVREGAVGLGFRVPMVVASPWSRGGYVNSQVFDHSSCLQFLEKFLSHKTGKLIHEPNISSWRRAITGDLTSVFRDEAGREVKPEPVNKEMFVESIHKAQYKRLPSGFKALTAAELARMKNGGVLSRMPRQEKGTRVACALPYELKANFKLDDDWVGVEMSAGKAAGSAFTIRFGALRDVRSIRSYAVKAGDVLQDNFAWKLFRDSRATLELYGPNGFYRMFSGLQKSRLLSVQCETSVTGDASLAPVVTLIMETSGVPLKVKITDKSYGLLHTPASMVIQAGSKARFVQRLEKTLGWYDFEVSVGGDMYRFAGHVENGRASSSDPAMGR